jgi:hypothetical protein
MLQTTEKTHEGIGNRIAQQFLRHCLRTLVSFPASPQKIPPSLVWQV